MAISTGALAAISIAATAAGTGMGVMSSIQQGKARQAQAEYQADVARQNQQLAEQQAGAQRREGYDNMIAKRQETARLIGRQRAAAGASGATVDVGSSLDLGHRGAGRDRRAQHLQPGIGQGLRYAVAGLELRPAGRRL